MKIKKIFQDLELKKESLILYQPEKTFHLTTDSLLLTRFVHPTLRTKKILDIGTGLGGIPLLLSRNTKAHITGVEIDPNLSNFARRAVKENHLEKQITIIHQDIREYAKTCPTNTYDIIVSNPPYFQKEKGKMNHSKKIATAKHETNLTVEDIFKISKKLLKDQGKLILVFTTARFIEILNYYEKYHFAIKKIQFIHGTADHKAKTFLIEGSKNGKASTQVLYPILLEKESDIHESKKL